MLSNIWVWDPRSGIRKKPIPDPGSWIQGSKRHRILDPGSGSATLVETLTGDGAGLEPNTRKHLSSKGNDHGLDDLEHSFKKAGKLQ